jgi:hypothetical protein
MVLVFNELLLCELSAGDVEQTPGDHLRKQQQRYAQVGAFRCRMHNQPPLQCLGSGGWKSGEAKTHPTFAKTTA